MGYLEEHCVTCYAALYTVLSVEEQVVKELQHENAVQREPLVLIERLHISDIFVNAAPQ